MDMTAKKHGFINIYIELLDEKEEEEGINPIDVFQQLMGKNIVVIESKSYFEAYCHVLKCLQ